MSAAASAPIQPAPGQTPRGLTLLELVRAVGEVTSDDRELVATILHMLRTGSVRLIGSFRNRPFDDFLD